MKRGLLSVALLTVFLLVSSQPAQALTVSKWNETGSQWEALTGLAWTTVGPTGETTVTNYSGDYEVALALPYYGASSDVSQAQAIWGAGVTLDPGMYKVDFTTALYTWDAYNSNHGYWDVFAVNLNSTNYYWNLGPLSNPVGSTLPGASWAWGGPTQYPIWSSNLTSGSLTYSSTTGVFLSVVLDTLTAPTDTNYASWGAFNPQGEVPEPTSNVPVPAAVWLLGSGLMGLAGLRRKLFG